MEVLLLQVQMLTALQSQQQQVFADLVCDSGASLMERFKRMGPPFFKGECDIEIAENWIREMEEIFRVIRCPKEDKVNLAAFVLQDRADFWLTFALRIVFNEREDISWKDFLVAFREQFVLEHSLSEKEQEFWNLTQGSMSIMEYATQFSELVMFVPYIGGNERWCVAMFVSGLENGIHRMLEVQNHQTMASTVRVACLKETE